jgi:uncharacterized protein YkwD
MNRRAVLIGLAIAPLAACGSGPSSQVGPDGLPLPKVYRIDPANSSDVQFRMLDGINSLRQSAGRSQVQLDSQLNAAAATHSRDMSVQNRPWHFGSDGSSPLDRARRVGFSGQILGENISETYETELETLAAWMGEPDTRAVILDRGVTRIGFSWFQEPAGKIWWTLVTAS